MLKTKIDNKKNKIFLHRKKGYTLVEVLVVLVILIILLTIGGVSLYQYMRYAQFKRQNEYAQTLFVAAENGLTHYKASGQLEDFVGPFYVDASDTDQGYREGYILTETMHDVTWDSSNEEEREIYEGRVCYIILTPEDYRAYVAGTLNSSAVGEAALKYRGYRLLEDYLYDTSIMDAGICLEMNPYDGTMYAVYYNENAKTLNFDPNNDNENGDVSVYYTEPEARKQRMVGYYGAELSQQAPEPLGRLTVGSADLINEATLYTRWNMSSKYNPLWNQLTYTLKVYDDESKALLMDITLTQDSTKADTVFSLVNTGTSIIKGRVQIYGTDGTVAQTLEDVSFRAWAERSSSTRTVMNLVLDAVDLETVTDTAATTGALTPMTDANKNNSFGFSRFGLDTEKIYVEVTATGEQYKTSTPKKTRGQHVWLGEMSTSLDGAGYTIRNARHLYNMRFLSFIESRNTKNSKGNKFTFNQTSSFTWLGGGGLVTNGWVFKGQNQVLSSTGIDGSTTVTVNGRAYENTNVGFPVIAQLKAGDTYNVNANSRYSISGLYLTWHDGFNELNPRNADLGGFGLFAFNGGTINGLNLENAQVIVTSLTVDGGTRTMNGVGAICGRNQGTLNQVTVSGQVTAIDSEDVGGVVGRDEGNAVLYQDITNNAGVTGNSNVGGIVGYLGARPNPGTVLNSENNGVILTAHEDGQAIGGIAGYNKGGRIEGCTSTPVNRDGSTAIENIEEVARGELRGYYVGGIVGFNDAGVTVQNDTGAGYVLGGYYVGGIIGFNTGTANNLDGENHINRAFVAGRSYVGGITGINAGYTGTPQSQNIIPSTSTAPALTLSNWENRGVVIAIGDDNGLGCSGGITGFNTGTLTNCVSNVDTSSVSGSVLLEQLKSYATGSHSGGLAGYNNGNIVHQSGAQLNCVVAGTDFVGGLTGYNDVNGAVDGYGLAGGYIYGRHGVGGLSGFNGSITGLQNTVSGRISVRPNDIEGAMFVGGLVGMNIISTDSNFSVSSDTQNFLGTIEGDAFVGGIIGYNRLVNQTGIIPVLADNLLNSALTAVDGNSLLEAVRNIMNDEGDDGYNTSGRMYIGQGDRNTNIELSRITGGICVGGVMGYNHSGTNLEINNVTNRTRIVATRALLENNLYYAYVGGIVGKNTRNSVIINCSNADGGRIETVGSYHSGLVEVNEGTIKQCTVASYGNLTMGRVGGLVGENRQTGEILDCNVTGQIYGSGYVGGLVSWNGGYIGVEHNANVLVSGNITGNGDAVGGIAGYNEGTIDSPKVTGSILGTGNMAGSIVGENAAGGRGNGVITNIVQLTEAEGRARTITGGNQVGGFVGLNNSDYLSLDGMVNYTQVIATGLRDHNNQSVSHAGGIVGVSGSGIILENCINYGEIESRTGGHAGGIIAYAEAGAIIEFCEDYGSVSSLGGISGGIAGVNMGSIRQCLVGAPNVQLSMVGMEHIGGISGQNYGVITNTKVTNVTVENMSNSSADSQIGGLVGYNGGTISGGTAADILVNARVNGCYIGGAAGFNQGDISGNSDIDIQGSVQLQGGASYANMGGIAGLNTGYIGNTGFSGNVMGNLSSSVGYGGVAGQNSGSIESTSFDGVVTAAGVSSDIVRVGGITGVNTGNITDCWLGRHGSASVTSTDSGYVGGVAGFNSGTISECRWNEKTDDQRQGQISVSVSKGNVGGFVGYNDGMGTLQNSSTDRKCQVSASSNATDDSTGGMIGFNASSGDLLGLVNYASVSKRQGTAMGGIVGRMQNQTSSDWQIKDCANHGDIDGTGGADALGGIIGRWKYRGGTLINCVNTGQIKVHNQKGGGIVGDTYTITDQDTVTIYNCVNYGRIYGSGLYLGGILGDVDNNSTGRVYINISDCQNVGMVLSSNSTGGILGRIRDNARSVAVTIERCENYGRNLGTATNFSGILALNQNNVIRPVINASFGLADAGYPISNANNVTIGPNGNFYFASVNNVNPVYDTLSGRNSIAFNSNGMTATSGYPLSNILDGSRSTRFLTNVSPGRAGTMTIDFGSQPATLNTTLDLYWYSNNANRLYYYTLSYEDASGATHELGSVNSSGSSDNITIEDAVLSSGTDYIRRITHRLDVPAEATKLIISVAGNSANSTYISLWEVEGVVPYTDVTIDPYTITQADINMETSVSKVNIPATGVASAGSVLTYNAATKEAAATVNGSDVTLLDIPYNPNQYIDKTVRGGAYSLRGYSDSQNIGSRVRIYQDIHPKLQAFYETIASALDTPKNVQVQYQEGGMTISWERVPFAYKYEVAYEIFDTQEEAQAALEPQTGTSVEAVDSGFTVTVPTDAAWEGKYVVAFVRAISATPSYLNSNWGISSGEAVKLPLPVPQVHVEYTANGMYRYVLDNKEDYDQLESAEVKIRSTIDGGRAVEFLASDGYSKTAYALNYNFNSVFSSVAMDTNDTYGASAQNTAQTMIFGSAYLQSSKSAAINLTSSKAGFVGVTPDTLSYKLFISQQDDKNTYYRSELLVPDGDAQGNMVVVSESEMRIAGQNIQTLLEHLPNDLPEMSQVTIRSYLRHTQAEIAYYGLKDPLAEGMTKDVLAEVMDYCNGHSQSEAVQDILDGLLPYQQDYLSEAFDSNNSLNPGYSLIRSQEGTYSLTYSTILADSTTLSPQISQVTYTLGSGSLQLPNRLSEPVLKQEYTVDAKDNNKLTFGWDEGVDDAMARYTVTLTGLTTEGSRTVITELTNTAENTLTADKSTWNYSEVELKVERLGTANNNGVVTAFGNEKILYYKVLVPLNTIQTPVAEVTDKNNLTYALSWSSVPGTLDEAVPYELHICTMSDGEEVRESETIQAPGTAIDGSAPILYINFDPPAGPTTEDETLKIQRVTKTYAPNTKLQIYVVAKAKALPANPYQGSEISDYATVYYVDSENNEPVSFTLRERLATPLSEQLTLTPAYGTKDYMTPTDFEDKGVDLTMTDNTTTVNGNYVMEYMLVATEDGTTPLDADNALKTSGVEVLREWQQVSMTGNLKSSEYTLKALKTQMAGQWVVTRVRSVSGSEISSLWTENIALQLPRVQLLPPLTEADSDESLKLEVNEYARDHEDDPDYIGEGYTVTALTLNWKTQLSKEVHNITLVHEETGQPPASLTYRYKVEFGVETAGDTDNIVVSALSAPSEAPAYTKTVNEDGSVTYDYRLDNYVHTQERSVIDPMGNKQTMALKLYAHLIITLPVDRTEKASLCLVLPDYNEIFATDTGEAASDYDQESDYTNEVKLMVGTADVAHYENSNTTRWYRTTDSEEWVTKIEVDTTPGTLFALNRTALWQQSRAAEEHETNASSVFVIQQEVPREESNQTKVPVQETQAPETQAPEAQAPEAQVPETEAEQETEASNETAQPKAE